MLYHPCAHPTIVNELRSLVANCLKLHIITPYNQLPKQRVNKIYYAFFNHSCVRNTYKPNKFYIIAFSFAFMGMVFEYEFCRQRSRSTVY